MMMSEEINRKLRDLARDLNAILSDESGRIVNEVTSAACERLFYLQGKLQQVERERDEAIETIKQILGWREFRDGSSFPLERVEAICQEFLANQNTDKE